LILPAGMLDAIVAHLRGVLPHEGCGLLAERRVGDEWVACRYFPGDNIDRSPTRFTMDPRAVVDALREIDARGWRLAAIVHSHPLGSPTPSPTDLREAYYPDAAFMIVGFGGGAPETRAWRLGRSDGTVVEVGVATIDEPGSVSSASGPAPEHRRA
jgi:proteasome lid subunit RPN8/RPN11